MQSTPEALASDLKGLYGGRFAVVRESLGRHFAKPIIPIVAAGGSLVLLGIEALSGKSVGAADLARGFAAPPLDFFGQLQSISGRWALLVAWPVRLLIAWLVVSMVVGSRLSYRGLGRMTLVYLGSVVGLVTFWWLTFHLLPVVVKALTPLAAGSSPEGLEGWAALLLVTGGFSVLVIFPLFGLGTAVASSLAAKAAAGLPLRPWIPKGRVWAIALAAIVLNVALMGYEETHSSSSAIQFAVALGIVFVQSVLWGAIAIESTTSFGLFDP